jgi:hypothetical protein
VIVFGVGNTLFARGTLLDDGGAYSGGSSGGFSITNSYNPPLGGFSSGVEPPLWQQILGGLSGLGSILDPYIFTEQERAQMELHKALAEAERARALAEAEKAAIIKERAQGPNWLLIGGAVLVGGLLVYMLWKG